MKKVSRFSKCLIGFLFLFIWLSVASAYESGEVLNGGTITGKVILNGPIPQPRVFPMVIYPFGDFCKKVSDGKGHVLLKEFNVDTAGGLQDAVVSVQEVQKGKGFPFAENNLVTVHCMFHPANVSEEDQFTLREGELVHVHPLVSVMRNRHVLSVVNRDPVIHDTQVYQPETGHRVVRFPIPVSTRTTRGWINIDQGRRIAQIICGMHEYMQTWAWIVDNPYFDKTNRTGTFTIENLPPGRHKVMAWHPHLKPIEKIIDVPPNGHVEVVFEFDARQVVRPIYETQEHFRIPPESETTLDLFGCEGPYCVRREHHHVD